MKNFLISQVWFTLIVFCEVVKWWCASQPIKILPWLKH